MDKKEIKPIAVRRYQAAAMLGSSGDRIDYLRRRGVLPGVKLTPEGQYLYRVADLERLVNGKPKK